MKKIIICFVLFLFLHTVRGQDIIITIQQDTISCRILSILPTHINYEQKIGNQRAVGKFIPVEKVLEYHRTKPAPFQHWRAGVQFGGSYLLDSSADSEKEMQESMGMAEKDAKNYSKQYRRGIHVGGDVHYLFNEYIGVGIKYSLFYTSASADFTLNWGDGINYICMGIEDRGYVNYVGPSIISGQWLDKAHKFKLTEQLSGGYAAYRGEERFDQNQYVLSNNLLAEGNSWGGNLEVSLEYYPSSWLSVSANAGLFYTTFKKLDITDGENSATGKLEKKDYADYSRMDYSIGVRFHF
jgi:hypothetical protein